MFSVNRKYVQESWYAKEIWILSQKSKDIFDDFVCENNNF